MDENKNESLSDNNPVAAVPEGKDSLIYEETPIIEPISPEQNQKQVESEAGIQKGLPSPKEVPELTEEKMLPRRSGVKSIFVSVFKIFLLFVLGIGAGMVIIPLASRGGDPENQPDKSGQTAKGMPSMQQVISPAPQTANLPEDKSYNLTDDLNVDLEYKLPEGVLPTTCDGSSCPSVGTYLPGGTRLTLAVTKHQASLVNFSESKITDASGWEFDNINETDVGGKQALSYEGGFAGMTTGGYTFTRMSGVMILVDPSTTVEINHFTPAGISADFDSDNKLFEEVLNSIKI